MHWAQRVALAGNVKPSVAIEHNGLASQRNILYVVPVAAACWAPSLKRFIKRTLMICNTGCQDAQEHFDPNNSRAYRSQWEV